MHFMSTPQLVHQESEDFVQMAINGLPVSPQQWTTGEIAYMNNWRVNVTAQLEAIPAPHAVFSPACPWHCSLESDAFWTIKLTTGPNLMEVILFSVLKYFRLHTRFSLPISEHFGSIPAKEWAAASDVLRFLNLKIYICLVLTALF